MYTKDTILGGFKQCSLITTDLKDISLYDGKQPCCGNYSGTAQNNPAEGWGEWFWIPTENGINGKVGVLFARKSVVNGGSNDLGLWCCDYWNSDGWSAWQKCVNDIPSFYKDYNSLTSLATALGGYLEETEQILTVTDFNDLLGTTGHFFKKAIGWNSSTLNRPSGLETCDIAVMFGWQWVDVYGIQLILTKYNNKIFYRSRYANNSWYDWVEK